MKRENIINVSLTDEDKKIILALVAIDDITTLKIHKALEKLTEIRDLKQLNLEEFLKLFGENKKESYRKFKNNLDFNFEEYFKFYKLMEEKHLIVSEYMPTSQIRKYRFLERNRIVATLSDGLIVTEAAKTSGTSRTVDFALDVGNCVFCLPGRFGDKMSFALNEHIKDGAILLNKLEDIKNEYHLK